MNQEAIIHQRESGEEERELSSSSVKRIADKYEAIRQEGKLRELKNLYNRLNYCEMFEPAKVPARLKDIEEWKAVNGNPPANWNAPSID